MHPKPVSKAAIKREQSERKRGIINTVTSAALHIIHDSHLNGSTIWPKKGIQSHSTDMFEKTDVIDVQVFVHYNDDGSTNEKMRINLLGTNYARMVKQEKQLESIIDQSIYDGVHFQYVDRGDIGVGLTKTWIKMDFTFTIQN